MTLPAFPAPAGFRVVSVAASHHEEQRSPVRVAHPDPSLTVILQPSEPVRGGWYELGLRFSPEGTIDCIAQFVHGNGRVVWMRLPTPMTFIGLLRCLATRCASRTRWLPATIIWRGGLNV